ncbi:MAG: serine hydrolase domain-containing protein [Verrucomicrobiota bacterium]
MALLIGGSAAAMDFTPVGRMADEAVEQGKVAGGTVLLLRGGDVVYERSFGFADIESKTPFGVDSPVIIASISKPLLGTAAFRLAEQGRLNPEAPITAYLPAFADRKLESGEPLIRPPTTIECFAHTGGLRPAAAPGGLPWFSRWTQDVPLAVVVSRYAEDFPFKTQPGTKYAYSGIGTDVAARVLEVAAGQPRNELLRTVVAEPLGMKHTFYRDAESLQRLGAMPTRYRYGKNDRIIEDRKRFVPAKNMYSSSGGAIISTAQDLARWLLMIQNHGRHEGATLLKRETVVAMLAAHPPSSKARGGFSIRKKNERGEATVVGHSGSSGTNCWIDFDRDLIGVMLTQTRGRDIKPFRIRLEKKIYTCLEDADRTSR